MVCVHDLEQRLHARIEPLLRRRSRLFSFDKKLLGLAFLSTPIKKRLPLAEANPAIVMAILCMTWRVSDVILQGITGADDDASDNL